MKATDSIIVISDYDTGCVSTCWYKGESDDISQVAKVILENYHSLTEKAFLNFVFARYKCDVLICTDGCIDYFEFNP